MSAAARILDTLRRVGQQAVLLREGGAPLAFTASIQPIKSLPGEDSGPLGVGRRRRYNLYAPANTGITAGSRLKSLGRTYLVLSAEELFLSGEAVCLQGVLELEKEEAP